MQNTTRITVQLYSYSTARTMAMYGLLHTKSYQYLPVTTTGEARCQVAHHAYNKMQVLDNDPGSEVAGVTRSTAVSIVLPTSRYYSR